MLLDLISLFFLVCHSHFEGHLQINDLDLIAGNSLKASTTFWPKKSLQEGIWHVHDIQYLMGYKACLVARHLPESHIFYATAYQSATSTFHYNISVQRSAN